jgi:hypothetical protein
MKPYEPGSTVRPDRIGDLFTALTVTIALLIPAGAVAEQYLPLSIGNQWSYQGVAGLSERQVVTGTRTVWGTETYVISRLESSSNEGLENYWTTGADGDVNLWGFYRSLDGWGVLYDPAIRWVDAPLYVGKVWSTTVDWYRLPEMTLGGTFTIVMSDWEESILVVPAGSFPVAGIGEGPYDGPREGFTLAGLAIPASPLREAAEWYGLSVGLVQYQADDLYQLVSFEVPTPVVESTWSKVKALYR